MKTQGLHIYVPHLQMTAAMLLGGSSIIPAKILAGRIPVFSIQFLSLVSALVVMLPLYLKSGFRIMQTGKRELLLIFLQALFGVVIFRVAMVNGLRYLSAWKASIVTSSTPVVLSVLSVLLLGEKFRTSNIIALILVSGGLVLLNLEPGSEGPQESVKGVFWIILAVFGEAGLSLFRKKSQSRTPAPVNAFLIIFISLALVSPFFLAELAGSSGFTINAVNITSLLYYGIIGTGLAYIFWGAGALHLKGCSIGIYTALLPLSSVILSILVLHEKPILPQLAGGFITFAGLIYFLLCQFITEKPAS